MSDVFNPPMTVYRAESFSMDIFFFPESIEHFMFRDIEAFPPGEHDLIDPDSWARNVRLRLSHPSDVEPSVVQLEDVCFLVTGEFDVVARYMSGWEKAPGEWVPVYGEVSRRVNVVDMPEEVIESFSREGGQSG